MALAEEGRVVAEDWRSYLKDMRTSLAVFGWVWRELINAKAKRYAKFALAYITVGLAVSMAVPFLTGVAIDALIARDGRMVTFALAAMTVGFIVRRLLNTRYNRSREVAQAEDVVRIDERLTTLYFEKSLGQHLREDGQLSVANVEKGRSRVHELESLMLFEGLPNLMELAISLLFLYVLSPVSGLMMTGAFVLYVIWFVFLNRKTLEVTTPIDAELRRVNRMRHERWDGVERVKTSGKETEEVEVLRRDQSAAMGEDLAFWLWTINVTTVRGLVNILIHSAVIAYGAWLVWTGEWTVGLLTPLIAWSTRFAENLWRIGQIEYRMNRAMPSVKSMKEALTMAPDVTDREDAVRLGNEPVRVELLGLRHAYPNRRGVSPHVLDGVSFSVEAGEKVALIGESGAGKTTVMRLLQRYSDPTGGAVLVNGHDLRDVALDSWKRLTAYIPQQAMIFDGTLRYNLLYNLSEEERAQVPDEALWEMMRKLRIDFGARLDRGLDTVVGRRGIKLSGGEAQRVMIGAAIVRQPRFLIVDEATSSLDSTTEKDVQRGLEEVLKASTSALIITHRLSTVRDLCSKFIVLRPSAECGEGEPQVEAVADCFEELYRKSPTFRRLADDQGVHVEKPPTALSCSIRPWPKNRRRL